MKYPKLTLKEEQLPQILSLLRENQTLAIVPQGDSMFPFFLGGRDTLNVQRVTFPLNRGDIVLYRRENGTYVTHRVHHVTKSSSTVQSSPDRIANPHTVQYYMLGDHQTLIEGPIQESQIYGVVASFERKGTHIDCTTNKKYIIAWKLWLFIRPIRPIIYPILVIMNKLRHKTKSP